MKTITLLDGETGLVASPVYQSAANSSKDDCVFQIEIQGAATVQVQGRVSPNMPWVVIDTISASDIKPYARLPQMRLNITSNSGTVNAAAAS